MTEQVQLALIYTAPGFVLALAAFIKAFTVEKKVAVIETKVETVAKHLVLPGNGI